MSYKLEKIRLRCLEAATKINVVALENRLPMAAVPELASRYFDWVMESAPEPDEDPEDPDAPVCGCEGGLGTCKECEL